MEKKTVNYVLNVNENFNPEDYISSENGREFIPLEAKVLWFRTVYPLGIMKVSLKTSDESTTATAKIKPESGSDAIISWSCCGGHDCDVQRLQEAALDKALELSGFGVEIIANSMISKPEDEASDNESEDLEAVKPTKKKRHRRTKAEMEAARKAEAAEKTSKEETEREKTDTKVSDDLTETALEEGSADALETKEIAESPSVNEGLHEDENLDIDEITFDYDGEEDDISSLMNLVDLESENNTDAEPLKDDAEEEPEDKTEDLSSDDELESALNVVVSTVSNAHPRLKQFDGMTLREVLSQHKDACEVFIRERIIPQMSPEVVEASKVILKSRM